MHLDFLRTSPEQLIKDSSKRVGHSHMSCMATAGLDTAEAEPSSYLDFCCYWMLPLVGGQWRIRARLALLALPVPAAGASALFSLLLLSRSGLGWGGRALRADAFHRYACTRYIGKHDTHAHGHVYFHKMLYTHVIHNALRDYAVNLLYKYDFQCNEQISSL